MISFYDCFLTSVLDEFGLIVFFPALLGLPLLFVVESSYVLVLIVKKKKRTVSPFVEISVTALSIWIWGVLVSINPFEWPTKSISNFMETGFISVIGCFLYAVRCWLSLKDGCPNLKLQRRVSFVVIPVVAILLAFLFPGLPE